MAKIIHPSELKPPAKKIPGLKGVATRFDIQDDGSAEEVDEFNAFIRALRREGMTNPKPSR
jgi:hypothetical protein